MSKLEDKIKALKPHHDYTVFYTDIRMPVDFVDKRTVLEIIAAETQLVTFAAVPMVSDTWGWI